MKSPSNDLFKLIKSLTGAERRYFKLAGAMYEGDKIYLELFNAIDKMDHYDETALKKKLKNPAILKLLPNKKQHLQEIIMKTLRAYHEKGYLNIQIKSMVSDAEILFKKGLDSACGKMLNKAKKVAGRHEKFHTLQEIYFLEKALLKKGNVPIETVERRHKEQLALLKKAENLLEYHHLEHYFSTISEDKIMVRDEKETSKLRSLMQNPLVREEERALSIKARTLFYHINTVSAKNLSDNTSSCHFCLQSVRLLEDNPPFIRENPNLYIAALLNLCAAQIDSKQNKECEQTVAKLKKLKIASPRLFSIRSLQTLHSYLLPIELGLCVAHGNFIKGKKIIEDFEALPENEKAPEANIAMAGHYHYALIYFGLGEYKQAQKNIQYITHETSVTAIDVQCFARILLLLIHYEAGNLDILEYLIRSTYRFMMKRKTVYKFETLFLGFVKNRLPAVVNQQQKLTSLFIELKEELVQLFKDPQEARVLLFFDFISWLESKIENRPFAEIVREKAGRGN